MKPIKSLIVLALIVAPSIASAQGYYAAGPGPGNGYYQGGFHHRMNRLAVGFSLGLGGMSDNGNDVSCQNCDSNPLTGEADFHIGAFVAPRVALLFEAQANVHQVSIADANNDDETLVQTAAMVAAQFWLTPQLWVKGGIGFAHLSVQDNDADVQTDIGSGLAVMGAIGYELMSARFFALDLQARVINGSYDSTNDNITSGTIGVGFNWY